MELMLTVTDGPHRGATFQFVSHDTFLVGRSPEARFSLPEKDPYFSRFHFLIEIDPPLCRLMDLKSRNGTRVNSQRVTVADLKNGDRIQAGHTTLEVTMPGTLSGLLVEIHRLGRYQVGKQWIYPKKRRPSTRRRWTASRCPRPDRR